MPSLPFSLSNYSIEILIRYVILSAVAFLQSMGLPEPMLTATRAQVEKGKLDFSNSLEYNMYSRHDKPPVAEE